MINLPSIDEIGPPIDTLCKLPIREQITTIICRKLKSYLGVSLNIPNESGIYFLFDTNQRLLYVGQAKKLRDRILHHDSMTPWFNEAIYISFILETDLQVDRFLAEDIYKVIYNPPKSGWLHYCRISSTTPTKPPVEE